MEQSNKGTQNQKNKRMKEQSNKGTKEQRNNRTKEQRKKKNKGTKKQKVHPIGAGITRSPGLVFCVKTNLKKTFIFRFFL